MSLGHWKGATEGLRLHATVVWPGAGSESPSEFVGASAARPASSPTCYCVHVISYTCAPGTCLAQFGVSSSTCLMSGFLIPGSVCTAWREP